MNERVLRLVYYANHPANQDQYVNVNAVSFRSLRFEVFYIFHYKRVCFISARLIDTS